jgi:hypothetical protein
MLRPRSPPRLVVRETFEATRLAPQCLISAYGRVVPVPRKQIRKSGDAQPRPQAARSAGGEHD